MTPLVSPNSPLHPFATGIAAPDMYRMSRAFVTHVHGLGLGPDGHRLLHALVHATCRDLPAWSPEIRQPEDGWRRPCLALRRVLGREAANGNRGLAAGARELLATGLFDLLGAAHRNSWLHWRFTDPALALLLDERRYGLLDARHLPALRSQMDFFLHAEVALVRRMRRPAFAFDLSPHAAPGGPGRRGWSAARTPVLQALRRCAAAQGMTMIVALEGTGYLPGIDQVHVRIRRPGSAWTVRELARIRPTTRRCLVVDGTGHTEIPPRDLAPALQALEGAGWRRRAA